MWFAHFLLSFLLVGSFAWAQEPVTGENTANNTVQTPVSAAPVFNNMSTGPTAVALPVTTVTQPLVLPTLNTTTTDTTTATNTGLAALIAPCVALIGKMGDMFSSTPKNEDNVKSITSFVAKKNEQIGYVADPSYDPKDMKVFGEDVAARYAGGTCEQKFIDKNGNLGPWGRIAQAEIAQTPDKFVQNNPPDITGKYCKGYTEFGEKKREAFWIWVLASMGSAESKCRAKDKNYNAPNTARVGPATGIFQVEKSFCASLGVPGDLTDPINNIRCTVRGLGKELGRRDNLMSHTSKGREATHWAVNRKDINNPKHLNAKGGKGDVKAHLEFAALLPQFKGCTPSRD